MTDTYIEVLERIADKLSDIYKVGLVHMGIAACMSMTMIMLAIYAINRFRGD